VQPASVNVSNSLYSNKLHPLEKPFIQDIRQAPDVTHDYKKEEKKDTKQALSLFQNPLDPTFL
jgi:hypothetical protein